jgi:hypothetical protein
MFLTEGPLDPQSPLFVGREAELRTMEQWLAHGNCVGAVAGARQTGKTSLLLQLRHRFQAKYRFVFIDLEALQNAAEGDCYGFICQEILDQLSDDSPEVNDCSVACNSASFLAFLRNISRKISAIRIAIILDEIGALPDATATALASTIRAIFTSRHVRADYARYIFILSGSTDIRRFATGKSSPIYNVTEKVYLADLSLGHADQLLVAGFSASGLQMPEGIRNRVLHWTAGHPYLTQLMGKRIVAYWQDTQALPHESQVDQIVGDLLQEEDRTLPHMRRVLDKGAPRLWGLVTDTLQGKKVRFSRSDDDLAELELAGTMAPQGGVCFIRNRIFQEALSGWLAESRAGTYDAGTPSGTPLTLSSADAVQPVAGPAVPLVHFAPPPTPTGPYSDLQRSLATGNVCAFVGAGLSVGAGLPGWYDLSVELAARISYDLPPRKYATGDALIDAAQTYVNRQGLHALISHLKDRLDTTGKQTTAAHRALARLPISLVFTANFDDLLERAFRDAGKRVEVVAKDSSIPFMRRGPDTVNIIKLYGDLDQPDTIVLARQQYESYFLQRPQMVKLLETELARSDTLYLGWSGSDPYFKLVFGELLSHFGPMMHPGYAVMFDVTDAQRDELARKQIRLVELPAGNRTAELAAWLLLC